MCGIVGLVDPSLRAEQLTEAVSRMSRTVAHRGPDSEGVCVAEGVALGMRRLAVVDTAGGAQPMLSDNDSVALVYNGEIYNAPALREELRARGVLFRSHSDTEVLLRLYEQDPEQVESRLLGMWAFALHDRRRKKLILSRDRFGIKPLFWVQYAQGLAFGSELRCFESLRPRCGEALAVDPASAHAMLSWGYVPEERTIYRGVRRLAPASRLEIDLLSGVSTSHVYYTPQPAEEAMRVRSLEEACELVEPALRLSVQNHLEADVPLSGFLSGGIDSSLVCAYAAERSGKLSRTYSVGFREPRFDESPYATETARRIGLPHDVLYLEEGLLSSLLPEAMLAYDEPFGDSSNLATFALCRQVAKTYKVALGGDGGDEVFAGYRKHTMVRLREYLSAFPRLRECTASVLSLLPVRADRTQRWTDMLRSCHKLGRGLHGSDATAYVALTQMASLACTAPLMANGSEGLDFEQHAIQNYASRAGGALQRTLLSDLANPLPNDMLTKVDRASMACSLEVRVPFLDHRLVELGLGLPARFTLGREGKAVLRALHERRFGAKLARRKKQGFCVPVESWLRGWLAPVCEELFSTRRLTSFSLLSSEALGEGRWRKWAHHTPQVLWNAFALALWMEATLGDGPDFVRDLFHGQASSSHLL